MEYYLLITRNCNLSCKYCSIPNLNRGVSSSLEGNNIDIDILIKFINDNGNGINRNDIPSIIFYGGEPLLNQNFIKRFIEKADGKKLKYVLHTNGTLLNNIDPFLLANLDYIYISIDGEREINDRSRGKGTFDKILKNIIEIKPYYKGKTLARLTVTPDTNLYQSVLGVIQYFDAVFWQIQNFITTKEIDSFKNRYSVNLEMLIQYWLENLKNNHILNIVPFQSILQNLLFNRECSYLRCGCGHELVVIDTDGNCYACDELLGNDDMRIGNINDGIVLPNEKINVIKHSKICKDCDIRSICGGRCYHAYKNLSDDNFKGYCELTRILVQKIKKCIPQIREYIDSGIINQNNIINPIVNIGNEQIP